MSVAIYIRVSSIEQVEKGYSIPEQTDRLTKYCEAKDWRIAKIYTDPGESGGNVDRPALKALIRDLEHGLFNKVLVYKLDRLSRSQKDTLYLIEDVFLKNNVEFVSMSENFDTSTPFGRAMIGILSVFAQLEREQIKERMTMGRVGRAKKGLWRGGSNPPIGYDFTDGHLIINDYEAMQVREIYDLFLKGKTMGFITRTLKNKYTNEYSSWNDSHTVSAILQNQLYIGKITYKDKLFEGQHEPIISEEIFNQAQNKYKEMSNKHKHHYKTPFRGKHLLSGLIFCGNCDARYFVLSCKSKANKSYKYYKCYSRDGNKEMKKMDGCKNPNFRMEELDQKIINEILDMSVDKSVAGNIKKNNQPKHDNKSEIINSRIDEINKQIEKLIDLYQLGTIPINEISKRSDALKNEKENLENELHNIEKESPELTTEEAFNIAKNAQDTLKNGKLDEKRVIVDSLIKKVVVFESDVTIYWKFC